MKRPDDEESLKRVHQARHESTPAERKLWHHLRNRQLAGAKFRRQVWLGPFIADFFCAEAKLIVEVDGDSHTFQEEYDARRTAWLASEGFALVRVTNHDVMHATEAVLDFIAARRPHLPKTADAVLGPFLSPSGRGEFWRPHD